ncbi:MAG: glycosyltransferase family 4 protein, partial [Verrucomicrobiota bacterium]|nr:glycosyltransferase family 4 protein [Verrucomicrobiota bacterium]
QTPVPQAGMVCKGGSTIDQFLPNCSYGDAISNYAIWIRDQLRALGFRSTIYARYIDGRMAQECALFSPGSLSKTEAAIYHHSIGSEITPHLQSFRGPKCMIYHNITPAEFFAPYRPEFAEIVQRGRDDLGALASDFPLSFGVSRFNADELEEAGFHQPGVLPIPVDPAQCGFSPDAEIMAKLQDGRTNLLFVGRIAPNKKQDDLLLAFEQYLALDPEARLVLIGKVEEGDPYAEGLIELITDLGLEDSILMPGVVTEAELASYYRTAHLFWSMSEHEGFCVPLVEAMWFDVPIFAYQATAIPETLGDAGLLFTKKTNMQELAAAVHLLLTDRQLRASVLKYGRSRRQFYLPDNFRPMIETLVAQLLHA